MEIPPEVRYVVQGGKSIAYQRFGCGDSRAVTFGNIGNLDLLWTDASSADVMVRGADRAEWVAFDQLGFGLSDPVDHVPTFEERAADLGVVMDAAGFERATICAIYDCCLTSMVFAAQHPERVDGLVLFNPFAQGWRSASFEELVGWDSPDQVEAYDRAWQDIFANWGRGASLRVDFPRLATPRNMRVWGMLERAWTSPAMLRTLHQIASTADVRDVLPSVQAPALVLRRPGDMLPEGVMRHVAERLPNGSYQELPAANSLGEFFADYLRAVEQFMFGSVRDANPDRALMTVLFTDIVGSTRAGRPARRRSLARAARGARADPAPRSRGRRRPGREADRGWFAEHVRWSGARDPLRGADLCRRRRARHGDSRGAPRGRVRGDRQRRSRDRRAHRRAGQRAGRPRRGARLADRPRSRDRIGHRAAVLRGARAQGCTGLLGALAVGSETAPLPAPDQTRELGAGDRVVLLAARRAPGLLRAASRIGTRHNRHKPEKLTPS